MTVTLLPGPGWPEDKFTVPPANTPPTVAAGKQPPIIELEAVQLRRAGQLPGPALDLTVWPGELVRLAGQPSSGRTALLNVLGLLDRPAAGRYRLNGTDTGRLRDRDASALRGRLIGFVFERRLLIPSRSVLDNVMLPLRYAGPRGHRRLRIALDCLERAGLADRARLLAWELSAGELALCAIARALVTKPSLLLCDEPATGAEPEAAAKIISLLAALPREGRTVIVATDDQLTAAYSSRSLQLGQLSSGQRSSLATVPSITTVTRREASWPR